MGVLHTPRLAWAYFNTPIQYESNSGHLEQINQYSLIITLFPDFENLKDGQAVAAIIITNQF
ncbi:MAG: hypothetical protein A3H67_00165 [Candidatus Buchananbacteria bacterium RIFCSPLOWO2_02_FULL_46_11b]|uniref:Uncharacterized protein n=1 Tax=Candidatus Buchananbacteria bacterium RIFCSPLOWO2_02_FULL_46_11b TaxID=1797548 RepID=A0A1G1YV54_9BACT|nr:MAG: hypothetical protein A3H67_00165 [Candidatus Buchananbacteria bacterium RIFCSPLOWO2_02_FULL_46_11b]